MRPGETVLDPFGGIGGGGLFAAPLGLKHISVELEPRFVALARKNFALHERAWSVMGYPKPVILQGDSRRLSELVGMADGCVMSPPFETQNACNDPNYRTNRKTPGGPLYADYGTTPGQIGNLKAGSIEGIVTSPPFTQGYQSGGGINKNGYGENGADKVGSRTYQGTGGARSPNNIENTSGDTYWSAMADVYHECHKILRPGGVICVVLKAYCKQGRRVPLPQQTLKLLIHLGFTPLERITAMLVKETVTPGLFGDVKKVKARKSFFRRLAESKGSPPIDWEEVLICRK